MKRGVAWLVGAAIVLAAGAVAVDRIVVGQTEQTVVDAVVGRTQAEGAWVRIRGFPFLTQVAGGKLREVHGGADAASVGGVEVSHVLVDARGVSVTPPFVARSGVASGALTAATIQAELRERSRLDVNVAIESGMLVASLPVVLSEVVVRGVPTVVDATGIGIGIQSVSVGGVTVPAEDLPAPIRAAVDDLSIALALPEGVELGSVDMVGDTVRVMVRGDHLPLASLVSS